MKTRIEKSSKKPKRLHSATDRKEQFAKQEGSGTAQEHSRQNQVTVLMGAHRNQESSGGLM